MPSTEFATSGVFALVAQAGLVVKCVLLMLLSTSVFCWAIILTKKRVLKQALKENVKFLDTFWQSKSLDEVFGKSETFKASPVANVFRSGFKELQKLSLTDRSAGNHQEVDNVNRALNRASMAEMSNIEKYLSWLATTASASPFVGLFGTVWGIMNSFQKIGTAETVNLAVVAPGISEALIATAVGLATAIPAVVAYNYFVNQVKKIGIEVDNFSNDFLNIIQRGLMAGTRGSTPQKKV